jgi:sortase A
MARRSARILSTALITASLVIFADVGLTLAWQEPVSAIYASIQQQKAEDKLEQLNANYPTAGDLRAIKRVEGAEPQTKILARRLRQRSKEGDAIGRIKIERMDIDMVMVEGTKENTLRKGPGHYPKTTFPGQGWTAGIAGHRTTYLAPFSNIQRMKRGDEIVIEMPYATLTYVVEKQRIVLPSQTEIVRPRKYDNVVLTACHPRYSAAKRYAVFGKLREIEQSENVVKALETGVAPPR